MSSVESKITIRCALQSFPDKIVISPHDWTVFRLKEHLRDVCPSEPLPERQRLIYAGQCLNDASKIGEVLRFSTDEKDQIHVFHLVYTPTADQIRKNRKNQEDTLKANQNSAPYQHSTNNEGLRNRFRTSAAPAEVLPQPVAPPSLAPGGEQTQQYWMQVQQQMYSAYMANYVNYVNQLYSTMYGAGVTVPVGAMMAGGLMPQMALGSTGVGGGLSPLAATQQPQNGQGVPLPQAQDVGPNNNNRQQQDGQEQVMNAQGGVDDEEIRNRDWLDWMYVGSRALLLVMILYFYSSLERFIFVLFACFLIYFWQAGWFDLRAGANREAPAEEAAPPAREEAEDNRENDSQREEGDSAPDEGGSDETPEEGQEPRVSPWVVFSSTCYTFVTTFFTSLIPERPPPVNVN